MYEIFRHNHKSRCAERVILCFFGLRTARAKSCLIGTTLTSKSDYVSIFRLLRISSFRKSGVCLYIENCFKDVWGSTSAVSVTLSLALILDKSFFCQALQLFIIWSIFVQVTLMLEICMDAEMHWVWTTWSDGNQSKIYILTSKQIMWVFRHNINYWYNEIKWRWCGEYWSLFVFI